MTAAEAVVSAAAQGFPVGPWQSADLVVLPVQFRAAAVLDTATGGSEWSPCREILSGRFRRALGESATGGRGNERSGSSSP